MLDGLFTTPVYSRRRSRFVNSAFSNKKILAQKSKFIYDKQIKRKCWQKFYVSSKQEKEWYRKTTSYLEQPSRHFCQHFMRRTTKQTLLALNSYWLNFVNRPNVFCFKLILQWSCTGKRFDLSHTLLLMPCYPGKQSGF